MEATEQDEVARNYDGKISVRTIEDDSVLQGDENKRFAHTAVGFANTINTSKLIQRTFEKFNEEFLENEEEQGVKGPKIECRHIDGKMPSDKRLEDLLWLKQGEKELMYQISMPLFSLKNVPAG